MLPTSSRALAQSRAWCCCASIAARTAATAASLALARSSATGTAVAVRVACARARRWAAPGVVCAACGVDRRCCSSRERSDATAAREDA